MRTVNFTQLRRNLAAELDRVINDAEEVVVTRSSHEAVVIVPLTEYEAMKETESRSSPVDTTMGTGSEGQARAAGGQ